MTFDHISQIAILVTNAPAIWLVGRLENWKRWGYVLGLLGQPFWFYTTLHNKQYGVFVLAIWYTYAWGQGFYNYWIKRQKPEN